MKKVAKRIIAFLTLFTLELAVIWIVFLVAAIIFMIIVKEIFIENEHELDRQVFAQLEHITSPALTEVMTFVTFFASKDFLLGGAAVLTVFFMFFKKYLWYSVKVPVIASGSAMLNQFLKETFDRKRPESMMLEMPGLSFPSGHAMIGLSFYGVLIYWVWTNVENKFWRWFWSIALLLWAILVGFSRIYLHVHYFTDVVAGFAAGFLWLVLAILVLRKMEKIYISRVMKMVDLKNGNSENGGKNEEK